MAVYKKRFDKIRFEEIKNYINSNLENELNVSLLSEQFGCSNSTFKRLFYYTFKQNIRNYILDCRMKKAIQLINEQTTTINIIAFEVGYKNRSSFTHAFSHYFGYPPTCLEPKNEKVV